MVLVDHSPVYIYICQMGQRTCTCGIYQSSPYEKRTIKNRSESTQPKFKNFKKKNGATHNPVPKENSPKINKRDYTGTKSAQSVSPCSIQLLSIHMVYKKWGTITNLLSISPPTRTPIAPTGAPILTWVSRHHSPQPHKSKDPNSTILSNLAMEQQMINRPSPWDTWCIYSQWISSFSTNSRVKSNPKQI